MIVNLDIEEGQGQGNYICMTISTCRTTPRFRFRDELLRLPRRGRCHVFLGERDYSMRAWLDPEKAGHSQYERPTTWSRRSERAKRPSGCRPGRPAARAQGAKLPVHHEHALGRLIDARSVRRYRAENERRAVRQQPRPPRWSSLRDVARLELGAQQYDQTCTLDTEPSVALSIYQLPGSNAIQTAEGRLRRRWRN